MFGLCVAQRFGIGQHTNVRLGIVPRFGLDITLVWVLGSTQRRGELCARKDDLRLPTQVAPDHHMGSLALLLPYPYWRATRASN